VKINAKMAFGLIKIPFIGLVKALNFSGAKLLIKTPKKNDCTIFWGVFRVPGKHQKQVF
jgi:hypothetical protein